MEMAGSAPADVVHPTGLERKALVKGGHAIDLNQGDVKPAGHDFQGVFGEVIIIVLNILE